jgi:hypothetical protein
MGVLCFFCLPGFLATGIHRCSPMVPSRCFSKPSPRPPSKPRRRLSGPIASHLPCPTTFDQPIEGVNPSGSAEYWQLELLVRNDQLVLQRPYHRTFVSYLAFTPLWRPPGHRGLTLKTRNWTEMTCGVPRARCQWFRGCCFLAFRVVLDIR